MPNKKKYQLKEWMEMERDEVMEKFKQLPNATYNGLWNQAFCYIPGTRKDRVLLVAHADTVWDDHKEKRSVGYSGGFYYSNKKHMGIGADDRAGCAIVWNLRNMGHSVLVVTGEESGCLGSSWLMSNTYWAWIMAQHQFAIQFDRRGDKDLVFYDVGSEEFVDYAEEETGYEFDWGSFTDIGKLCKDICGVNMSVGYYDEHTRAECLVFDEWFNTLQTVRKWISQKDLPKFERKGTYYGKHYGGGSRNRWEDDEYWNPSGAGRHLGTTGSTQSSATATRSVNKDGDEVVTFDYSDQVDEFKKDPPWGSIDDTICGNCSSVVSKTQVEENDNRCPACWEYV